MREGVGETAAARESPRTSNRLTPAGPPLDPTAALTAVAGPPNSSPSHARTALASPRRSPWRFAGRWTTPPGRSLLTRRLCSGAP